MKIIKRWHFCPLLIGILLILSNVTMSVSAESILRVKINGELKSIDPIWTTSYPVRNHGYIIYDTLFAMNEKYEVRPQMVDDYNLSADGKVYTLTLRKGLMFHDGQPVRSVDCVESLKRWGARDGMGQQLMSKLDRFEIVNDKTFKIIMKEKWGLVLNALGKISSTVPFIMPERLAKTDPFEQVKEPIGSGPFRMIMDEWVPGSKVVYEKFKEYVPRSEPASGAAGGKVAKVDRIEWLIIPDALISVNALLSGEVDWMEAIPPDMLEVVKQNKDVKVEVLNKLGQHVQIVLNHHQPPFDNVRIRQAVQLAMKQQDYLLAAFGKDKTLYQECGSVFFCGTRLESWEGSERVMKQDMDEARRILKAEGYDGTPIVVLHATDIKDQNDWGFVTTNVLKKMGFVVDVHTSDWATVASRRASKASVKEGGWHVFHTGWSGPDMMDPSVNVLVSGGCLEKGWYGWPCDEMLANLKEQFSVTTDPDEQKEIARKMNAQAHEIVAFIPMGQFYPVAGYRKNVKGVLQTPVPFFRNIEKK